MGFGFPKTLDPDLGQIRLRLRGLCARDRDCSAVGAAGHFHAGPELLSKRLDYARA